MISNTFATMALVALLALSLPAGIGARAATAQDGTITTIDEDNPLASDAAGTEYDETGMIGGTVSGYDMRVTAASEHDNVGLDGLEYTSTSDAMHNYLRIQYNESIERTVRFYVHKDIWYPHYRELDAENDEMTATLTPVKNSSHTAVELTLTGPTDAVFQVPKAVSGYYYARDTGRGWIENQTGYQVPSIFGGTTQWDRVDATDLADANESVAIGANDTDPMIQYDAADRGNRWVPVPSCDNSRGEDAPVCTFDRPDDTDHVYVLADSDDPPPVRYKHGTDMISQAKAGVNELLEVPSRIMEQGTDLFGGSD